MTFLKWLTARTWGKWLVALVVIGILLYFWQMAEYRPYEFQMLVSRIKFWLATITGMILLTLAIWASFTPSVPADKIGVRIVKFPLLDQLQAGEVVTTTMWFQGTYANPIPPGTSKFFPLIRVWMWMDWVEIEHRDLTDIDPRAVGVLISSVGERPADENILYWGNGVGEYSGVILKADVPGSAKARGILSAVLQPGKHSINVDTGGKLGAFKRVVVDTSPNTIHLDDHPIPKDRNHHKFGSILLKTADGFPARIELEVVLEIQNHVQLTNHRGETFTLAGPDLIVARNGSFEDAIRDVVVPITQSAVNAAVAGIKIGRFIDDMEGVQNDLLKKLQEAIDAKYPQGDSAIRIMNVSLIFNPKGFPQTEEYIKTRTDKARQEALRELQAAEKETNEKFTIPLRQVEARAKFAEVEILAQLRKAAAESTAEANRIELDSIAQIIQKYGLQGLAQVASFAFPLLRERFINEGESMRDTAEIQRGEADTKREAGIRADANGPRRQRGKGGRNEPAPTTAPTGTAAPAEQDEDEE